MGMAQPWWYSLPKSGVPSGAIRIRMRAVSMFTSRRLSAQPRSVRGPWQIGHTAGAISAAPQEVAVAAQLQGWMLAWGIWGACQIISEHFWIDGGDYGEGRATVSLVAARPRRVFLLWCISGSRANPGHCRRSTSHLASPGEKNR